MRKTNKLLFILLTISVVALTFAACVMTAGALDATGKCGENVNWNFNSSTGALTLSGSGATYNYDLSSDNSPFSTSLIKKITINSGVTSIGNYLFYRCTKAESISIPNTVKTIGERGIYSCDSLQALTIPNGVESIGAYGCYACGGVTSVSIPASLASIGDYAFHDYYSNTAFTVAAGNPNYSSDGSGCLYNKAKTALLNYPLANTRTSFKIPNGVKFVDAYSFADSKYLEEVEIPHSVTTLSTYVFKNCSKLRSVIIGGSVTYMAGSFRGCSNLETVYYRGTEEQWNNILNIDSETELKKATKVFNYADPGVESYSVTVHIEPKDGGRVSGAGVFAKGESTQLKATPNQGFCFIAFYDANGRIGNLSPSFDVKEDRTYTAKFVFVNGLPLIKNINEPLDEGDWYFDQDALFAAIAEKFGMSVEEVAEAFSDIATVLYDPQSGIIAFLDSTGKAENATVIMPEDGEYYDMYKAGIKQYHAPAQPDPGQPGEEEQPPAPCPWCGGQHEGFFQSIIGWFHNIFASIFGARY